MPFVSISLMEGRPQAQKKAVACRITDVMVEELGIKPEHLWIRFQDTPLENWFTGPDSEAEIRERLASDQST